MAYLKFSEKSIEYANELEVERIYNRGYLFGRVSPGYVYQTRSLRIDLGKFSPNSENRRILRKIELNVHTHNLPMIDNYNWQIHKLGKDFYSSKFPDEKFTASKIREMLTKENHFDLLFEYKDTDGESLGYCIAMARGSLLHYCYPFYNLDSDTNNIGMAMMLNAILWAQMHGKRYVYLGGATRAEDRYKLQFSGLEWYDETGNWNEDIAALKQKLTVT